ncbi:MAG TPA: (2Fe-2S)-binding protein [Oscillatoriaceae cyanobacterium]
MLQSTGRDYSGEPSWPLTFKLNGETRHVSVDPTWTLFEVLREQLDLTGTKGACLEGECGSCTVLVDGRAMNACLIMAPQVADCEVVSVEGLADGDTLSPIQQAFVACGAVQCGYCTPGLIVQAHALLKECPYPTREEIRKGLEGNICRCTGYMKIEKAVQQAAASAVEAAEVTQ